jgi:hypothetical protein
LGGAIWDGVFAEAPDWDLFDSTSRSLVSAGRLAGEDFAWGRMQRSYLQPAQGRRHGRPSHAEGDYTAGSSIRRSPRVRTPLLSIYNVLQGTRDYLRTSKSLIRQRRRRRKPQVRFLTSKSGRSVTRGARRILPSSLRPSVCRSDSGRGAFTTGATVITMCRAAYGARSWNTFFVLARARNTIFRAVL